MSAADDIPDEVPAADAAEQQRDLDDSDDEGATGDPATPLESDPADWQEQQLAVEDPEDDEAR